MSESRRYVMFHRGPSPPGDGLAMLDSQSGVTVIDRTTDRAMLIEATEDAIQRLRQRLPDWVIEGERTYELPERFK